MVNIPQGLYTENVYSLNLAPAANMYAKLMAQQEAKKAVLDKYFRNLTSKATETGMRSQELPAFQKSLQDYKSFVMQNGSTLSSGRYPELMMQAEQLAQVPFRIAAASKEALNVSKTANQISATNPDAFDLWTDETTGYDKGTGTAKLDAYGNPMGLRAHEEPIYSVDQTTGGLIQNPKHKTFDLTQIKSNPKFVDWAKEMKDASKDAPLVTNVIYEKTNKPFMQNKVTTKAINPGDINGNNNGYYVVGENARSKWNRGTEFYFHKDKPYEQLKTENGGKTFADLTEAYQKAYGQGAEIKDDRDLFVAMAIKNADVSETQSEPEIDQLAYDKYLMKEREAASKRLAAFSHNLSKTTNVDINSVTTAFEQLPEGEYTTTTGAKVTKKGNQFIKADGTVFTSGGGNGDIRINSGQVSPQISKFYPSGVNPLIIKYLDLEVKNGQIQNAKNPYAGLISRGDLLQDELKDMGVKSSTNQQIATPSVQTTTPTTKKTKKGKADGL